MKWRGGRVLRLVCVCLVCLALPACWPFEPDDDDEPSLAGFILWQFIIPYHIDCHARDAIDISSGGGNRRCRSGRVYGTLIVRSDTGEFVTTASVPAGGALECRCPNGGPSAGSGARWFTSTVADPPKEHPVSFAYEQVELFAQGILVDVIGWDAYAVGDHLICVPATYVAKDCSYYQVVTIE